MADRVATYRLDGRPVEIWRGDALSMSAGVVLFGRNRALRASLEATTGRQFGSADRPTAHGRRFDLLPIGAGAANPPWRLAVSLDYRPRNVKVDACQTYPNLTHVDKLSDDVWWAIYQALRRTGAERPVLLLPLSYRHPQVVAVAQVLAVWSAVVDGLPFSGSKSLPEFRLVDFADPSPFVDAIEDRDGIVTRTLQAGAPFWFREGILDRWKEHSFKRE